MNTWHQWLVSIDQMINASPLFRGWADETLSARAYRCHAKRKFWYYFMKLIDALFFWQNHHCRDSYLAEQERRQLPPEYRDDLWEDSRN